MKRLLAISPHLDDAAFSAGGTLALHARAGWRVEVVTCFTGNVAHPAGFALACQLDKGLPVEVDYMALRRDEDRRACAAIGATATHLSYLEAPHRGYGSAAALFGGRIEGDDAVEALSVELMPMMEEADLVMGPVGIGGHVDHGIVREAMERADLPLLLWEDWPYLDRPGVGMPAGPPARTVPLDDALRDARTSMCRAYASQIGFQFGSVARMVERIGAVEVERFHRA